MLALVEPPVAASLELLRLAPLAPLSYSASRNRQWHIYSAMERKGRHSLALRRVFLRCVDRGNRLLVLVWLVWF